MLKITLKKSVIGYSGRQKLTVKALGLRKLNSAAVKPNNPQIRGMIKQISHLVEVQQVDENMPGGSDSETQ